MKRDAGPKYTKVSKKRHAAAKSEKSERNERGKFWPKQGRITRDTFYERSLVHCQQKTLHATRQPSQCLLHSPRLEPALLQCPVDDRVLDRLGDIARPEGVHSDGPALRV